MGLPTYIPLASITLAGSDGEIIFNNIPSYYRDLVLVVNGKNSTTGADSIGLRINSDNGNNYSNARVVGTGSGTSSYADTTSVAYLGVSTNSSNPFVITANIMDYSSTNRHKTILARCSQDNGWVSSHSARWANTAAVTSISVLPPQGSSWTFTAGATFSLFGIRA